MLERDAVFGETVFAVACGFDDAGGTIRIDRRHPTLALVEDELVLDAVVFGGTPSLFGPVQT